MTLKKFDGKLPSKPDKSKEKELAELVKDMLEAQKAITDVLDDLDKAKPALPAITAGVDKLRKRATGRSAELKDLEKEMKRGLLHTNPSKLERLAKDFKDAVDDTNKLDGSLADERTAHFEAAFKTFAEELVRALPKGTNTANMLLPTRLKAFKEAQAKGDWAKFNDTTRAAFIQICVKVADAQIRETAIKALASHTDFAKLKAKARDKIIEAGIKDDSSVAEVRTKLEDAFTLQDYPSIDRWKTYLALGAGGGYRVTPSGAFEGSSIHITMSKDSWTDDADGKVSVSGNTAAACLEKLLKVKGWKQLHATLEATADSKNYPHVFLYAGVLANDTKWEAACEELERKPQWITGGQKALTSALDTFKAELIAKIQKAQELSGPIL